MEGNSSDWKEFENTVQALETEGQAGNLKGAMVFLATDKSTMEGYLYKGNSPVKKIFELVVRVKKLELVYGCHISVTHVSWNMIQAQGTDGVSQGLFKEGVTTGLKMLSLYPWDKSALEASLELRGWSTRCVPEELEFVEPKDWFYKGHELRGGNLGEISFWRNSVKKGCFVCTPSYCGSGSFGAAA